MKFYIRPCLDDEGAEYEDALEECGYGRFHYWLLFVCGWANASDAIEVRNTFVVGSFMVLI